MRLGFHYHLPAEIREGKIWTIALQGLFLDSLAIHFDKIVLFLHSPKQLERDLLDYELLPDKYELVNIGIHDSVLNRLIKNINTQIRILKILKTTDLILFRVPTPLLPLIIRKTYKSNKYAFLVVGEASDHIHNLKQPFWRKYFIKIYILWNEKRQKMYAKNASLIFTNSTVIFEKYKSLNKNTILIRTTTLQKSDFFKRSDACTNTHIKILYTGRIEETKGLLTLANAVVLLNERGIVCTLNIVGWAEPGDKTQEKVINIFDKYKANVNFHGKKKAGPELFEYYKSADVFVMPSQVSEGFPRTIWEAMAHSVPVVTTTVGSIPYILTHEENALFIKPFDSIDIANKIQMLVDSSTLCAKIVENGWKIAQDSTLEKQAHLMSNKIIFENEKNK